jgi:hypothetical protein
MTDPPARNSSDEVALTTVKELAAAVSTQARISNRVWLALITATLVAVIPRPSTPGQDTLALPFGLGGIAPGDFYFGLFGVLVVLTIAFAAAHAQQIRAQELAQRSVNGLEKESRSVLGIHPRDYFDMVREPSRQLTTSSTARSRPASWWRSLGRPDAGASCPSRTSRCSKASAANDQRHTRVGVVSLEAEIDGKHAVGTASWQLDAVSVRQPSARSERDTASTRVRQRRCHIASTVSRSRFAASP